MLERNIKEEYLDKVCGAVRWKQAHSTIRRELSDHIEDQAAAFRADGMEPEAAMERAVLEMGSAEETALGLDASYRPRDIWPMTLPIVLLVLAGIACRVWLTSTPADLSFMWGLVLGTVCALLLSNLDLYGFAKYSPIAFALAFLICAIALSTVDVDDMWRYANNPVLYYCVCLSPCLFAGLVYSRRASGTGGLLLCGLGACCLCLLLLAVPSGAGVVCVVLSCLSVLTLGILSGAFGSKKALYLAIIYGGAAIAALLAIKLLPPYAALRLDLMLHPQQDPSGAGYLPTLIREAVGSARLIGPSVSRLSALEQIPPDLAMPAYFRYNCLLTLMLCKWGWLPTGLVLTLLLGFLLYGFRRALGLSSLLGRLLAWSIMSAFGAQSIVYVLFNLGIGFAPPVPLPFIGPGNTALVINLAMAGVLLSLLRSDGLHADTVSAPKRLSLSLKWE